MRTDPGRAFRAAAGAFAGAVVLSVAAGAVHAGDPAASKAGCEAGKTTDCRALGNMYARGEGVTQDPVAAATWFDKGCKAGDGEACADLGHLYFKGSGVPKDDARAAALFRQGCDADSDVGCMGLAGLLTGGWGVPKDAAGARALYEKVCRNGFPRACLRAGVFYEDGALLIKSRTAIPPGFLAQGCQGGQSDECSLLGLLSDRGAGVPRDPARAAALFKQACDGGSLDGCSNLGRLYATGSGVPKDVARAAALFKQACGKTLGGCVNLEVLDLPRAPTE